MRKHHRRGARAHGRELVVTPGRGETLNPRQSAWLREGPHRTLLRYDCSIGRDAHDVTLRYDIDGLVSLRSHLRHTSLGEAALVRLMLDVGLSLSCCARAGMRSCSMLFDPRDVFVDGEGHLSLAFVPLDGMGFGVENSPLMVLRALGDGRRLRFADQNARVLSRRLSEFVLAQSEVFSLNAYRAFLRAECGHDICPEGRAHRIGPGAGPAVQAGARGVVGPAGLGEPPGEVSRRARPVGQGRGPVFVRLARHEEFALRGDELTFVGRGSACQVRLLGNRRIGRRHLVLRCGEEGLLLQDLGSGNGTTVHGTRLDPAYAVLIGYGTPFVVADEACVVRRGLQGASEEEPPGPALSEEA